MNNAEYGSWEETEHYIWYLTQSEFDALWEGGAFSLLNQKFNKLIDDYEDEDFDYQSLLSVKDELFEQLAKLKCKKEVEKLKSMITLAISNKTKISFAF